MCPIALSAKCPAGTSEKIAEPGKAAVTTLVVTAPMATPVMRVASEMFLREELRMRF
jgi:hypothetical protein